MSEPEGKSLAKKRLGAIFGIVVVVLAGTGFVGWSTICPCDRSPGGYLFGEVAEEQIADWSFANDVPLCQIQVGRLPYSINLNCMATSTGELYLSCGRCESKRWGGVVLNNSSARMRLEGTVYPVTVARVLDPDELDRAWDARVEKLQVHGAPPLNPAVPIGTPRPDQWWSFRVASR